MGAPESPFDSAASAPFRVFINYRRSDSGGYAGRISDALNAHAKASSREWDVFMDIDTIDPGVDFAEVIDEALNTCDIVITVIGRSWLQATDAKGRRRLEHPDDFVRLELEAALSRSIRVIPTLVQGAEMPSSEDLPDDLARLARRNALELSDARWRFDMDRLIAVLDRVEQQKAEREAAAQAELERTEEQRIEQERALAAEQAAKEAAERAERTRQEEEKRLAAEREAEERLAREQAQREAAAGEAAEREAAEREAAEREAARAAAEREAAEREAAVRAAAEAARLREEEEQRAEAERERVREQEERERAEYEAAAAAAVAWEREQAEREAAPALVEAEAVPTERETPRHLTRTNVDRGVAAFGLVLFVTAIWTPVLHDNSFKYWNTGDGASSLLLALALAAAIGGSVVFRDVGFDIATAALGFVAFGFGLFEPVHYAASRPGVGGVLGFVGPALVVAGGMAAAGRRRDRVNDVSTIAIRGPLVVSALGLALFVAAVWTRAYQLYGYVGSPSVKYWDFGDHHAMGILMLVLGSVAIGALAAGSIGRRVALYLASAATGLIAVGVAVGVPLHGSPGPDRGVALAFVASALITAGGLATAAGDVSPRTRAMTQGVVGAGIALLFAAIWLDGSYWDLDGGHERGIFLVVLCVLGATVLGASVRSHRTPAVAPATVGLVALGFTLFVPLGSPLALRIGSSLAVAGSILLVAGAVAALQASRLAWPPARPSTGEAVALVGIAMVLAAGYPGAPGSFWDGRLGGFLLLVGLLCALSLVGKLLVGIEALATVTRALGLVALGFALNPVVDAAFGDWQDLPAATWLAVVGTLLIVAGTTPAVSRRLEARHALTPGPA